MQDLAQNANKRLGSAYKCKTWDAYKAMFMTFMAFCDFTVTSFMDPNEITIIAFIEFLCFNDLRFNSVQNYVSAIKSQKKWFKLPVQVFGHTKMKLMLKAVEHTNTKPPIFKGVFDLDNLINIVLLCQLLPFTTMFQALYLAAFFVVYFRMSNLVPISKFTFDFGKDLCRGDILFEATQAVITVKWSKISTKYQQRQQRP